MELKNIFNIFDVNKKIKYPSLFKIKSCYFLKKLYNILKRSKILDIIKYNKKSQKILNVNIKNYKEYSENFTPIEIEIKLLKNIRHFINISKKELSFYHIYTIDDKKETADDKIKIIKIIIDYEIKSFENLFRNCLIRAICFKKFYRTDINNMSYMFYGCSELESVNLSNFNTEKVIDMSHMFEKCSLLKTLDLTSFKTKNVINMDNMFDNCSSLKSLDLSNFDTSNARNIADMFARCYSMKSVNLSSFDTKNIIDMNNVFSRCKSLESIDLSSFDTKNVIEMHCMFEGCQKLKLIDLCSFDTKNVIDMRFIFRGCKS